MRNLKNRTQDIIFGILFISFWIIGFFTLTFIPLVNSIVYSFNNVIVAPTGIQLKLVGLGNFRQILSSDIQYVNALIAFLQQLVLNVPIIIVISLIIAVLLNQEIKMRGLFRTIYFLPVIITSGPIINELISTGATAIPMMEQYGISSIISTTLPPFIAKPIDTLFSQIILVLWFSGVQVIIFLAGLQKIDKVVYEAARIDGASPWESFWKVTLPSLKNLIVINVIYTIVTLSTFSGNAVIDQISGSMFAINKGYGYASAQAWLYFLLVFLILMISIGLIMLFGRRTYRR